MSSFASTLRDAVRGLRRRPGFAAVAIATIALAIGANTAIWSVVSGALLRPLPFRAPARLISLDVRSHTGHLVSLSVPNYRDWRDRNRVFEAFAASAPWSLRLTGRGEAQILNGRALLGDVFGVLGLTPAAGRLFTPAELGDRPGGDRLVVLGHAFWQQRFGGDPAIVGQTLTLAREPYTVIGVLPPGAGFPSPAAEFYFPMAADGTLPWDDRDSGFGAWAIGRLKPGVTLEAARQDMERVNREVRELAGPTAGKAELATLTSWYVGDVKAQLWILLGAVGFVLLIAIANVGNLLLARGEDRSRELTVRAALGAGRGRLVRLLLAEALAIAAVGGVLGAGLAWLAVRTIVPLLPTEIPAILRNQIRVDGIVLLFGIGLALVTGVVFGLVPALRSTREIATTLRSREGSRTTDHGRGGLRQALVVVEVALALVLLVSAGLMLKSLDRLINVDKGFDATGVLTGAIAAGLGTTPDAERWRAFYGGLQERAERLPGVESAAFALLLPLANRSWELRIHKEGVPVERETGLSVLYNVVSTEYFETFGVPLVRGRTFGPGDREGAVPVTIIDETMAKQFWPGEDPLGKRVTFETATDSGPPVYRTVVGVAKNVRHYELMQPSRIQAYVPLDQSARRTGMTLRFGIRTAGNPADLTAPLRAMVSATDPDAVLFQVEPLKGYVDRASAQNRAMTRVLAVFGAGALGLAALGIFGVMSYAVTRRTREIGIRIALGAAPRNVMGWVGGQAMKLTVLGLVLGVASAAGLTRVLGKALFEVSPLDPMTYVWVTVVLGATALLAAWLPARRALKVDPAKVLGDEG
ncbi:MAG TPA: ABC transporter permease [Gemmatimonadales bacterium]|nr:ABC transporter permease [Gemmatimonadales bacterium]